LSGGTAVSAMLSGGGIEYVRSAGTDSGATLSGGSIQAIEGGTASAVQVLSDGFQQISGYVGDLGYAINTTISSGGRVLIRSGGVASVTTLGVGGSGSVKVASGGTAIDTVVSAYAGSNPVEQPH
jgi:fibronectin-binding autotransporter adhesin